MDFWGVSHDEVEQCFLCCARFPGIVSVLRHWEPFCPVGLLVIDVYPQVLFYPLIGPFRLSIGLGVECRTNVLNNVQTLTQSFYKVGCEAGIAIANDFLWESVVYYDVSDIQFYCLFC